MQRRARFLINAGHLERRFVPANGSLRKSFVEEALCQPGVSLHQLREGVAVLRPLRDFLEFADGLVEQAHLAERDAEVVMCLWIFVGARSFAFELLLQLTKHVSKINPCT